MKSKVKLILIIFCIIVFGYAIKANAAISASSKEVNTGEQFSITVTSNIALGAYSVKAESYSGLTFVTSSGGFSGNGTTTISNALEQGGTTSLATFTFKAPEVETDTKYTIKFVATGMGDENLNPVSNSSANATITVKAKQVENNNNNNNNNSSGDNTGSTSNNNNSGSTNNNTTTTTKSSEARLKNLGITPNDFKGFKRDTYTYNVEVPNNVSKVKVYAQTLNSKAKITSGTGNVSLKEGANTVKVVVTAEDGTQKTYTLNITRKAATVTDDENNETDDKSSEARLSNLGISPKEYDFSGFKKDTTSYSVEVPNEVEEVEVYADAVSSKAKVTGIGKVSLKEGKNNITVEVTAEDGTKKAYTIEITRKESEAVVEVPETTEDEILGLTSLIIKNFNMSPKFDAEIYEYTLGITEDLSSLQIDAQTENENVAVEIIGNENLQQGENVITILVSNTETDEVTTYQIIVNKNVPIVEEETFSWSKPSTWGIREIIIVVAAILLIVVIVVAIIVKIKLSSKDEEEDFDLPGGDELDRALAEHQELTEDTESYQQTQETTRPKTDIEQAQEYYEMYMKKRGKRF